MLHRFVVGCAAVAASLLPSARVQSGVGPPPSCNTNFTYPSFPVANFSAVGSAQVNPIQLNLTQAVSGQAGAVWFSAGRSSLANGFDTTFGFSINGTSDGMAFVVQDQGLMALGSSGSGLGYSGITRALAVEIDTFCFTGEFGCDHISVQTNGVGAISSDDSASLGRAVLPIDVNDGLQHFLRIVYVPGTLAVFFEGGATPILTVGVDLTDINGDSIADANGCVLFGFTGATGGVVAQQDITTWSFTDVASLPPVGCGADFVMETIDNPLDFSLVGSAFIEDEELVLTPNASGQAGAAWYRLAKANVLNGFTTEFTFTLEGVADGIAFVLQNESLTALGDGGSGIGYGSNGPNGGIIKSIAVELDTFCFQNEFECDHISVQTRGIVENSAGDAFSITNLTLTNDFNDSQPHVMRIEYNPGSLSVTVDGEGITTGFNINDYSILDDDCIYIGFTGGTGAAAARQSISSWTFTTDDGVCVPASIDSFDGPPGPVPAPQGFSLTVNPGGTPPFTYEWYRNGQLLVNGGNISGATTDTLTVGPTNTNASAQYDVTVTNDCGGSGTGNFITVVPACDGNADGNGVINFTDVVFVLANFGNNYGFGTGLGDADANGVVNFGDIVRVLARFNTGC